MPVQLTIIGRGQIGTSVGLALASEKDLILRMGHDKENGNARLEEKMGALDKTHYNRPASVRDADIVPRFGFCQVSATPRTSELRRTFMVRCKEGHD